MDVNYRGWAPCFHSEAEKAKVTKWVKSIASVMEKRLARWDFRIGSVGASPARGLSVRRR